MALTLISVETDHVVYATTDGEEIMATPLPIVAPLVYWEDFDLADAWFVALQLHRDNPPAIWSYRPDRDAFVADVRRQIVNANDVSIVWCDNCEDPTDGENAHVVRGSAYACQSCFEDNYRCCDSCDEYVHYEDLNGALSNESVCSCCLDNYYAYCEDCDGYYHDCSDCADDHRHSEGCDCESAALAFTMPNGDAVLNQDERITIGLPAGVISDEGMRTIASLVRQCMYDAPVPQYGTATSAEIDAAYEVRNKWYYLATDVFKMDPQWQTKEGNFTKRLSKLAHKTQGLKISPDLLTKIGNVARDNSQGAEINLEFTRNLNLSAEDFYHEDSCWWQSYSESRCALKTNGGIGMRTFSNPDHFGYTSVTGRAWVMPLRRTEDGELVATFDTTAPDAYIVFNGYGDLSGYTPARIMAQMSGMTYRKIGFSCSPMYVNGSSGYLVAPEEIAATYTNGGHLDLDVDQHSNLHAREQRAADARELVSA